MGICATISPGLRLDADGTRALDPLLWGTGKAVQTRLFSKPVEFNGIKIRIVDLLPNPKEFKGVAVAQPVADEIVASVLVFITGNVC